MAQDIYTSTSTWVCPSGVTSVDVECWGGGGGGGNNDFQWRGGGGGGGAYSKKLSISVTPGNSYTVTVGAAATAGNAGNDSWFSTSGTVLAKGGSAGGNGVSGTSTYGAGGAGGSAASGIGDTKYSGGAGATGNNDGSNFNGGGGGSSAGTASNGNNGTTNSNVGGAAVTGGGSGGNGSTGVAAGSNGNSPGGGGGGGNGGGTGAAGKVIISYSSVLPTENVDNTLTASHSVTINQIFNRSLSDNLSLTIALDSGIPQADVLILSHQLSINLIKNISISDSLTILEEAIPAARIVGSASNDLSLSQSVSKLQSHNRPVSDSLVFGDALDPELKTGNAVFNTSGTWVCPPGVASVEVRVWGGGGGGGGRQSNVPGGGGGGGAYSTKIVPVTEGTSYSVVVGAGGTGSITNGTNGGDSYFESTITVLAKGGKGGTGGYYFDDGDDAFPAYGAGGAGGLATDGVGTTRYKGGTGAAGVVSGKGGSSAGTLSDGISGLDSLPVPDNAGAGGNEGPGSAPGGGGGGRFATNGSGYDGSPGRVVLMYYQPQQRSHTLSPSHSVVVSQDLNRSVNNTLELTASLLRDTNSNYKYDTIGISDSVVINIVKEISLSDTLAMQGTDVIAGARNFLTDSHSLVLDDILDLTKVYSTPISDTLAISHSLNLNTIKNISISDGLTLSVGETQRNIPYAKFYEEVPLTQTTATRVLEKISPTQEISLSQLLGYTPRHEIVSNLLEFAQALNHNLVVNVFSDSLSLSDSVIINWTRELAVSDLISFGDSGFKVADSFDISQDLELSHNLTKIDEIVSLLSLNQNLDYFNSKLVSQSINLGYSLNLGLITSRGLSDTIGISDGVVYLKSGFSTCGYSPFSNVLPPRPTLTKSSTISYTCGSDTLVLKSPDIGDTEEISYKNIVRETLGGTLRNYRQSTWPKTRILKYTFDLRCSESIADIQTFLKASLGKEVELVDYWGRTWTGVIINPDASYREISRTTRKVTIQFQGMIDDLFDIILEDGETMITESGLKMEVENV